MRKLFIAFCTMAVLSVVSNFATAEEMGCTGKFTPEMKAKMEQRRAEFEQRLNLTPEQKEKMKAIHQESRAKIKPLFESLRREKEKMQQLESCQPPSQKNIQNENEKISQIKSKIKDIRKINFDKTMAILNPDQQKEFIKMREEHKREKREMKNSDFPGKSNFSSPTSER